MDNNRKEEQSEKKETKKSIRDNFIFPLIIAVISALLSNHFTAEAVQKGVVETLSTKLDYIEATDKLDDAIAEIVERDNDAEKQAKENESTISETEQENKELQKKLNNMPKVQYNSISIVKNGLKTDENINNGWATIDNRNYYSEDSVNSLLESKVHLDEETNTLFYDITGTSNPKETKVKLENTKVLYDGAKRTVCDGSTPNLFSIGSKTYSTGFILETTRWDGYGNALFDLENSYSKISFDVGRLNDTNKGDAKLRVYFSKNQNDMMSFYKDYELSADTGLNHIEIDLNHYYGMKFELIFINEDTSYGFTNIYLEY